MRKEERDSGFRNHQSAKSVALLVLATLIFSVNCGKKGPLKLEPRKTPTAIRDISVRQVGNDLKILWSFPSTLSDKKTRVDFLKLKRILIYSAQGKLTPKKFKKKSSLLKKLTLKESEKQGQSFTVTIPFRTKNLENQSHSFSIRYVYQKSKSPFSPLATIETIAPVKPVSDLTLSQEGKLIILKWSRPRLDLNNKPAGLISGYRIYRKINDGDFIRLNQENVIDEYYEDKDTGKDGTYSYRISAVSTAQVESQPSNTVSVQVKDVFPPDSPHNLISFKAEDHIFLTWNQVEDRDLDFYRIFRKTPPDEEFKLIAGEVRQNYYKDTAVRKGQSYTYIITAVDKKGNESQASNPVEEEF